MPVGAVVNGVVLVEETVLFPAVIVEFPTVPFPALPVALGAGVMVKSSVWVIVLSTLLGPANCVSRQCTRAPKELYLS